MLPKRWLIIAVLVLFSLVEGLSVTFLLTNPSSAAPHRQGMITLVGKIGVLHHDPGPGSNLAYHYDVTLVDQAGNVTPLLLDISTASRLQDKTVKISGYEVEGGAAGADGDGPAIKVGAISIVEEGDTQAQAARIGGSYPFVNILCRVSNGATEQPTSYFTGLFSASYPGINHYWQQMSGGLFNVTGSATFGWFNLSGTSSSYDLRTSAGRQALYNECTGLADAQVNFASYSGVNLIINHSMQNVAYGGYGGYPLNRDGVSWYRYTWLPSWAWQNESPFVHEMGHAIGMPHSSGAYGAAYDSQWDVMSDTWGSCGRPGADDPTYGCLPQGTNSFHLDTLLGWIPGASKVTVNPGQTQTVTLERLNQPYTTGYRMVQVPFYGVSNRFYVVEARRTTSTPPPSQYYDAILPGNAVILHDVLNNGSRSQPAQVVDIDNNSNPNDAAAQWTPGEVFTDNANGITMRVLSQTNTGYTVQVSNVYGDTLARFNNTNGNVSLVNSLLDNPVAGSYTNFPGGAPVTGQWVMGDWNGDGLKTPGLYGSNGVFYFTNSNATTSTWGAIWVGLFGRPAVAGRFTGATNDCLGVVDSGYYAGYGTAFALYFTCNFTSGPNPPLIFQWLSVVLGDAAGFGGLGAHQFAAGDFNGDGIDTIAVRRGPYVAFTNVAPTTLEAAFNLAQYFGTPSSNDYGIFLSGDWNNDAIDSFGVYYGNGYFYRRNDVQWNTGQYSLQRVSTTIGTSSLSVTSWRSGGAGSGSGDSSAQSDIPPSQTSAPSTIESNDPTVRQDGLWQLVNSPESSGGGYLVTTSVEQSLEYSFNGSSVEIIYAQLGAPASFTILVDDVAVRTIILPDSTTAYRQSSLINYLNLGEHTLRIVSLNGPVAVDAFSIGTDENANERQTTP